ncbi:hypothetical protein VZG28_05200 [Synechococcus elongatus IITB4]|uniref:hypothetical protein n=1 Tax=Synechococcus elongatus TaxID=32046 RepID=UPI0030CDAE6D
MNHLPTLIEFPPLANTAQVEVTPSRESWTDEVGSILGRALFDYSSALVISGAIAIAAAAQQFKEKREKQRISLEILPPRERRRVQDLLAQMAVLIGADRVVLGIFHNGSISFDGLHFSHLAIPFCYEHPSMPLLPELMRDIPVGSVMRELEAIWKTPDNEFVARADEVESPCRYYLETRGIKQLVFRSRGLKGVDVLIFGYHWAEDHDWVEGDRNALVPIEDEIIQIVRLAATHRLLNPARRAAIRGVS